MPSEGNVLPTSFPKNIVNKGEMSGISTSWFPAHLTVGQFCGFSHNSWEAR